MPSARAAQAPASSSVSTPELDNLELVVAMGSPRKEGFNPIPPSQISYALYDPDPQQQLLAWVRMSTLGKGRRSRYCVDENRRVLNLEDAANFFRWTLPFAERVWKRLESRELVCRDEEDRLCLNGNVPQQPPAAPDPKSNGDHQFRTELLPSYLVEQYQQLTKPKQDALRNDYCVYSRYRALVQAQVQHSLRKVNNTLDRLFWGRYGITVTCYKKDPRTDEPLAKLALEEVLPEEFDRVLNDPLPDDPVIPYEEEDDSVRNSEPIPYGAETDSARNDYPLCISEAEYSEQVGRQVVDTPDEEEAKAEDRLTDRQAEILAAIPQSLLDKVSDVPTGRLLDKIGENLGNAPLEALTRRIEQRFEVIMSLGVLPHLALDAANHWRRRPKPKDPPNEVQPLPEPEFIIEDQIIDTIKCRKCFGLTTKYQSGTVEWCKCGPQR